MSLLSGWDVGSLDDAIGHSPGDLRKRSRLMQFPSVGVVVERRRSGLMAEQTGDGDDRGASLDSKRCGGIAQVVRGDVEVQGVNSGVEHVTSEVPISERCAIRGRENDPSHLFRNRRR